MMIRKISLAVCALITVLFWSLVFQIGGINPLIGAAFGLGVFVLAYHFRHSLPRGLAMAGVYVEIWTGELVKQFSTADKATWLDGIPDMSGLVDNKDTIHLVEVGVDPDVLINNTTYPIPLQSIDDDDIAIKLDKYQTKVTPVTDDELYALSYDKISTRREGHGRAILRNKFKKAIHALAPAANGATTPVLKTTGPDDGTGRLRLIKQDILNLKTILDNLEVPDEGRRLVLCPDHVNDLLAQDQRFVDQYFNYATGKIANFAGFEIYQYVAPPYYNVGTLAKLSFGGTPVAGTHYKASVAFIVERTFKATGSTKMYYSEAQINPETQQSTVNFRHYFLVMPKLVDGFGAIVSGTAA